MTTKNSVVKIQNLLVNHESQPAKSNPEMIRKSKNFFAWGSSFFFHYTLKFLWIDFVLLIQNPNWKTIKFSADILLMLCNGLLNTLN